MSALQSELDTRYEHDICQRCGQLFRESERHQHPSALTSRFDRSRWRCGEDIAWQRDSHEADEKSIAILRDAGCR